jgi:hypothetical protein
MLYLEAQKKTAGNRVGARPRRRGLACWKSTTSLSRRQVASQSRVSAQPLKAEVMTAHKLHLHNLDSLAAFVAMARWQNSSEHDATMAALFTLSRLEPPPTCLTCGQNVENPVTVGIEHNKTFVICSDCADDNELERRILERLTERPETSAAADPATQAAWVEAAAKKWVQPATERTPA